MYRPRLASNKLKTWFIIASNWEGWTSHLTGLTYIVTTRSVRVQIQFTLLYIYKNAWLKETLLLRRNTKTTKSRISRSLKFSPICLTFCKKYMGRVDVYDFDEISAESSNKVNLSFFKSFSENRKLMLKPAWIIQAPHEGKGRPRTKSGRDTAWYYIVSRHLLNKSFFRETTIETLKLLNTHYAVQSKVWLVALVEKQTLHTVNLDKPSDKNWMPIKQKKPRSK